MDNDINENLTENAVTRSEGSAAAEDGRFVYRATDEERKASAARRRDIPASICEWLDAVCLAVIFGVLFSTFCFKALAVEGTSMVPTYKDGQRVMAFVPYGNIKTGDVVITDSNNGLDEPLFKRVVAVEYQYVTMDPQTGAIYVDGVLFDEPIPTSTDNKRGDIEYPFYVPAGKVFLMGDNRRVSNDSRYSAVGFIDIRSITGKAVG